MTPHDTELRQLALATLFPGFEGTLAPAWLLDRVAEGLAGVVLFERNVPSEHSGDTLVTLSGALRRARPDVIVAVDEEGGDVTRLDAASGSNLPGAAALGVVDDPALTARVGDELGARLRGAGLTLNLAPVADVDADPMNPIIGIRSFGTDPVRVGTHVAAFVQGQQQHRVAATAKHFPGHGATDEDSHVTVPVVAASLDQLSERELVPFRAAVSAGVKVVMSAHVAYPALDDVPATLSHTILTDVLRHEVGFAGVVMSDGLDMYAISRTVGHEEGAVLALMAGADALCVGGESTSPEVVELLVAAIIQAVHRRRLPESRLREAASRVQALAQWTTEPVDQPTTSRAGREAAARAVHTEGQVRLPRAPLVLELHDGGTIAAGEVPWAVGAPLSRRLPGTVVVALTPQSPDPLPALLRHADRPVVVCVRGVRRRPWQARVVESVRARRPDVVVVDHELPSEASVLGPRHILTYSGSLVSAEAAADLLAGQHPGRGDGEPRQG